MMQAEPQFDVERMRVAFAGFVSMFDQQPTGKYKRIAAQSFIEELQVYDPDASLWLELVGVRRLRLVTHGFSFTATTDSVSVAVLSPLPIGEA